MQLSDPFRVITPTLDGPVLAVLALAEERFTTGQVHRLLGSASEEGVRRVLKRLTAQGIVEAERVGAAFAYRLNREHLAAPSVVALANARAVFLQRLGETLAGWADPPLYAAVFGSAAHGVMRDDSDIDLLLVRRDSTDDGVWDEHLADLVRRSSRWTGNDVRPLEYTVTEVAAAANEAVLLDVVRDGLTVFGDPSWLRRQFGTDGG